MPNLKGAIDRLKQVFQKDSVRDSLWMIGSKVISVAIQAFYFIFVARLLGSEEYGRFIGVSSLVGIVSPFVGLGHGHLLVRTVSRARDRFREEWGKALVVLGWSAAIGLVLVLTISYAIWQKNFSATLVLWAAIADFAGVSMLDFTESAFISVGVAKRPAQLKVLFSLVKLSAVGVLLLPEWRSAEMWAIAYCIASVIPAGIAFVLASRQGGWPLMPRKDAQWELQEGFLFAIATSAETINAHADKTMLSSLSTERATGIYGAGYRFVDVGYQPIIAVGTANYGRFFQAGTNGLEGTIGFARRLLPAALSYGILAAIGMVVFAPVAPMVLGSDYQESMEVLRVLFPIHLLAAMQYLAADSLTGAGYQRQRSIIQVSAAVINISLNALLIPLYSWHGAAWATLTSEGFKFIGLWSVVAWLWRKEMATKRSSQSPIDDSSDNTDD